MPRTPRRPPLRAVAGDAPRGAAKPATPAAPDASTAVPPVADGDPQPGMDALARLRAAALRARGTLAGLSIVALDAGLRSSAAAALAHADELRAAVAALDDRVVLDGLLAHLSAVVPALAGAAPRIPCASCEGEPGDGRCPECGGTGEVELAGPYTAADVARARAEERASIASAIDAAALDAANAERSTADGLCEAARIVRAMPAPPAPSSDLRALGAHAARATTTTQPTPRTEV